MNPEKNVRLRHVPAETEAGERDGKPASFAQRKDILQDERYGRLEKLSPRERELCLLLVEGYTLKESAARLQIKYSTANTHVNGIYKKLGVNSRADLIINYRALSNASFNPDCID